MTLSIAELAREARDEQIKELPAEYFDQVFGGCMSNTCFGSYCIDDYEDLPDQC